jgi:SAM-dependent methyltransferase
MRIDMNVPDVSALALLDLMGSYRISAVIHVAARLDIMDFLAGGPMTSSDLARRTGAHEPSLRRLLRALVTIGLCKQIGNEQFDRTEVGAYLADGASTSLKAFALYEGEVLWHTWNGLFDSVCSGKTRGELENVENGFDLMACNPNVVRTYNAAMESFTRLVAQGILAAYDFSNIRQLLDLGGGSGGLLAAVLKSHPALCGTVVDLPRCSEEATRQLAEAGVSDRGTFVAGDFFESVPPGADAIVMKSVIHDWSNDLSAKILRNCRQALPENGRLLLVERVMPEKPEANAEHRSHALSDLNMLRGPGGGERTEHEYRQLLLDTGFSTLQVKPAGRFSLIEARVA